MSIHFRSLPSDREIDGKATCPYVQAVLALALSLFGASIASVTLVVKMINLHSALFVHNAVFPSRYQADMFNRGVYQL